MLVDDSIEFEHDFTKKSYNYIVSEISIDLTKKFLRSSNIELQHIFVEKQEIQRHTIFFVKSIYSKVL